MAVTYEQAQEIEDASKCLRDCVSEKPLLAMAVYLLWSQLHPGDPMTYDAVNALQADSACVMCLSEKSLRAALVALLYEGGGGGAGTSGTTNLALAGVAPPTDGSVPTFRVYDTVAGFSWYNSGTIAAPTWNSV